MKVTLKAKVDQRTFSASTSEALTIEPNHGKDCIKQFPNGSSGGISGLFLPQHLKDAISVKAGDVGEKLLICLTKLIYHLVQECVPSIVHPILFGAKLIALRKKCGGPRAITIVEVVRRLAA